MSVRHFLDLDQIDPAELRLVLDDAKRRKRAWKAGHREPRHERPLADRAVALMFDKPSTRTRTSFDVGIRQLGGEVIHLASSGMHMGADKKQTGGETLEDTTRVLSRYVDAIMLRTTAHDRLLRMAEAATVPVINGLTDDTHPCQIMADIMTFEEHRGPVEGRTLAWVGDGNNVLASLMQGAEAFGYHMNVATPKGREPNDRFVNNRIMLGHDPREAVRGADAVITDTWVSMGDAIEDAHALFEPFRVDGALMADAADDAIFLHCLPAHRGEEVVDAVLDGPASVVLDEAENRLHAQKSVLVWCLSPEHLSSGE